MHLERNKVHSFCIEIYIYILIEILKVSNKYFIHKVIVYLYTAAHDISVLSCIYVFNCCFIFNFDQGDDIFQCSPAVHESKI